MMGLSFVTGRRVRDAMQTRFRTIESGATMETAAQMLLDGSQHDFPIVVGEEVIGVLKRTDIARGLATEGPSAYVAGYADREFRRMGANDLLEKAMDVYTMEGANGPILVFEGERLIGLVTPENISEFIMLEHARRQSPAHNPST